MSRGAEPRPRSESFSGPLLAQQVVPAKLGSKSSMATGAGTAVRFSRLPRELGHLAPWELVPWLSQGPAKAECLCHQAGGGTSSNEQASGLLASSLVTHT